MTKGKPKTLVVQVSEETYAWFKSFLPMHGATQWFLETSILKAKELHEAGKIEAPVDILESIVRDIGKESL